MSTPSRRRIRRSHHGGPLGLYRYAANAWLRRILGVALRRRATLRSRPDADLSIPQIRPFVQETTFHKSLHFSPFEAQSRMLKRDPDRLVLDYTRTMMGFLLFNSRPDRIGMIGLGGGSLVKFCYRELPRSCIEVAEINPHVIALRDEFHLPPDDARLQVHRDDGARFVAQSSQRFDVLLVDAYAREGIPPKLTTTAFYRNCRAALRGRGMMVLNLFCEDSDAHIQRIRSSFGGEVLVVDETDGTNRVVFACAGALLPPAAADSDKVALRRSAWLSLKPALSRIEGAINAWEKLPH